MRNHVIKDFHVTVKLRNNQLVERREALNMSAPQVARAIGISYGCYLDYENMKHKPFHKHSGDIKGSAEKISKFFGASVSTLWSHEIQAIHKNILVRKFSGEQARELVGEHTARLALPPDKILEHRELRMQVQKVMKQFLTEREYEVVSLRYGLDGQPPATLADIAQRLQPPVQGSRVAQIADKALRKLKYVRCVSALGLVADLPGAQKYYDTKKRHEEQHKRESLGWL